MIEAAGAPLVAPLLNGHTHAAMTLFRGYGDDLPLMRWLEERIWPIEARLEADDVYWGTRLACVEMIRTGTVRFWDMYWQAEASARAVRDAGLRATIGAPLIDADGDHGSLREAALESLDHLTGFDERVRPSLAPHAIYTVSEESLRWIGEVGEEHSVPVQIHLSETQAEVERCVADHGLRPAHYLDRLGMLGPRTLLAHGVWLDASELELIAERGATVVTNPVANMKLAVGGVFPLPGGPAPRRRDRPRHRWRRLEQLARPPLRPEGAGTDPEARRRGPLGARGRRGVGDRDRRAGRSCSGPAPSRSASRPTSCCSDATPMSWASATFAPASSTPPRARSSTPPWSPGAC